MAERTKEKSLRTKAETALSQRQEVPPLAKASMDKERLIHELQVHQIELEMQNDELRKAQEEIETSRSKYMDLYDFAPVGYFTLDNKGVILEANLTGAKLLGVERGLLLKTAFSVFIMADDQDLFQDCRRKVFQIPGRQSCEVRLKRCSISLPATWDGRSMIFVTISNTRMWKRKPRRFWTPFRPRKWRFPPKMAAGISCA